MKTGNWRRKLGHELKEWFSLFLVVSPFFLAFVTYRILLLSNSPQIGFEYGTAIVNALVLSKIVLVGEWVGLGARSHNKPLIFSTIHKSAMFTLFYIAFHAAENLVRARLKGQPFSNAFQAAIVEPRAELLGRALVMFFAFMPFFALWEVRRVMGPEQFSYLFLHGRRPPVSNESQNGERGKHAA